MNSNDMFAEPLEGKSDDCEIIRVHMDIQLPIETLKVLLQEKTKKDLSDYDVWIQNVEMLEPFKTLVDQCVKGEGSVQVNAQILDGPKRINIADVVMDNDKSTDSKKNIIYRKHAKIFGRNRENRGNRTGNNGQIQLWWALLFNIILFYNHLILSFISFFYLRQFLLNILFDKEHTTIIQWYGNQGEFKLVEPDRVAALWGIRKNKPTMNYEKLSRALRYYYDGDMISKVNGKKFVYKFICDLKQLTGYSAQQLSDLVNGIPRQPKPRRFPERYPV